jgi:hypothetical protein
MYFSEKFSSFSFRFSIEERIRRLPSGFLLTPQCSLQLRQKKTIETDKKTIETDKKILLVGEKKKHRHSFVISGFHSIVLTQTSDVSR